MNEIHRQTWQETKFRKPGEEEIDAIAEGRRSTALQRLAKRYRVFSTISATAICLSLLLMKLDFVESGMRPVIALAFGAYFFTASVMDLWLSNGISKIDCINMTVHEVICKALFYRKRHFQFMAVLLPAALAVIGLLAWQTTDNVYILACMAIGFLLGLALGLKEFYRFMADYRDITAR